MMIPIEIVDCTKHTKVIDKGTGGFGNRKMSGDHPNDSIIKINQNTKKSSGNLLSLSLQWETVG